MVITFLRTVILYVLIIAGIRLLGKRQIGELEPTELVLALLIADLAAVPMQDLGIPLLAGIVPILTLLCLTTILSILNLRSPSFRALLCGRPSIVIQNGKIDQHELRRNRLTLDELTEELRLQGITDLESVKYAVLETNGQLSVLLRASEQPVTPKTLGRSVEEPGLPLPIVRDGVVLTENLKIRGLSDQWLREVLAQRSLTCPEQVFLLTVDELGHIYCAPKEDTP